MKTGVRNAATVFLMTDAHVADEKFLVLINDLLASGEIPDLFMEDEIEEIVNSIRPEVKSVGILDTKENCWKFFIEKVRKQLKVWRSAILKHGFELILFLSWLEISFQGGLVLLTGRQTSSCACSKIPGCC